MIYFVIVFMKTYTYLKRMHIFYSIDFQRGILYFENNNNMKNWIFTQTKTK